MVITKTPMRISLAGGGSDFSTFYREYGGCVLSTSISKYMYIMIHPYFDENMISLKYSQNELVSDYSDIKHKYFKFILQEKNITGVEITSTADVPSGTGLGSSSSFTTGLLHAIYTYLGKAVSHKELAEEACRIEIDCLKNPIGKQDQYAASYGGFNFIRFHSDDTVNVEPIVVKPEVLKTIEENLVMFYTGITHESGKILAEQKKNIRQRDKVDILKRICSCTYEMRSSIENNQLDDVGLILDETWHLKRELAKKITNPMIDDLYSIAVNNGAIGGKVLGAGGGGFLLFYCPKDKQNQLSSALGLKKYDFQFEKDGTTIVYSGNQ